MTAPTPAYLYVLANDVAKRRMDSSMSEVIHALRTAADQLEAVQAREQIDDAMVERAARAMFEGDGIGPGDYSWDEVVRNDGSRAHLWRADARQVLGAALIQNGADR